MSEAVNFAKRDAVVADFMGRRYVAIHPGYALSAGDYRCGLATRIVVCVLSFIALVLNIVGQVVPYYEKYRVSDDSHIYYSPWQVWTGSANDKWYADANATVCGILAVVAAALLLIGVILAGVLAGAMSKHERERLEDKAGSELAMSEFGRPRQAYGDDDTADAFPYTNLRVMNCGQVKDVLYETAELTRLQYDRDLCAATLSMLIFAAGCNLSAVVVMAVDYASNLQDSYSYYYYGWSYIYGWGYYYYLMYFLAGIPLMAVSTALSVVAFILVAIPQATKVPLCGKLKPQSCVLMVLDDVSAAEMSMQFQQYVSRGNPNFAAVAPGVRTALPGPTYEEMSRPCQTNGVLLPAQLGSADVACAVPVKYTTANYITSSPSRE